MAHMLCSKNTINTSSEQDTRVFWALLSLCRRRVRNRRSGSGADLDVDFRVLCEAPARGSEAPEGEGLIEDEAIEVLVLRHRHTEKGRTTVAVRLAGERG